MTDEATWKRILEETIARHADVRGLAADVRDMSAALGRIEVEAAKAREEARRWLETWRG